MLELVKNNLDIDFVKNSKFPIIISLVLNIVSTFPPCSLMWRFTLICVMIAARTIPATIMYPVKSFIF